MAKRTRIIQLLFRETGTYQQMHSRPYVAEIDGHDLISFAERTDDGTNFSREALAGLAGSILSPQAHSAGVVDISGGYHNKRYRFVMEVSHEDRFGGGHRQVFSGYTDYMGADPRTRRGNEVAIDPNMKLYLNSVMTIRDVVDHSSNRRDTMSSVFENSHILSGIYKPSLRQDEGSMDVRMRPEDVFASMTFGAFKSNRRSSNEVVHDTRTSFADGICKSRRSNSTSANFLSDLLTTYSKTTENMQYENTDRYKKLESARGSIAENYVTDDLFLGPLYRETSLKTGNWITFQELIDIDPDVERDEVTQVHHNKVIHRDSTRLRDRNDDQDDWADVKNETVAATILAHAVPAIMMDLTLTQVAFIATNRTRDNRPEIHPTRARMFSKHVKQVPEKVMNVFLNRLEDEVLRDISNRGRIDYDVEMDVNVFGDSTVKISMLGGRHYEFIVPSFSDAAFVPVLARSSGALASLAQELTELTSTVDANAASRNNFRSNFMGSRDDDRDDDRPTNGGRSRWTESDRDDADSVL